MYKRRLILINIIGIVIVVGLIAGGAFFYYENNNFVRTDDAVVSADIMQVVAPASGVLKDWNMKAGKHVAKTEAIGKVSDGKETLPVHAMDSGTVIKNEAKANEMVQAGQVLAETADMNNLYITANIKETDIKNIEVGNSVDITVDGDADTTFNGTIQEIGYATNSVFSALPSENSSGNYTKVTQKVPVKISIQSPSSKVLPGMNAEIKISI
ncbi:MULTISPECIES: HlyD family efflux transporter periplasmic adaptor subunit [Bacillaceae]|uniref:HlyD family efflux transporter periplasmic adaptor subunit n=1 Tax=Bacillaceae TaxID=186817 RepID=UPI000E7335CB|nr:HlyD family efflux transporter periplasmic adaptor subunit [Bacillus sp. PK3_68]RJS62333.1 transporter [Bacillus sp. PK3_68]